MTFSYKRPADAVTSPSGWNSTRAIFNLRVVDRAEGAGILLQWALSRHIGAEIKRAGYTSTTDFTKRNSLNHGRISAFLGGHRKANFQDLAVILEVLGPRAWPSTSRLTKYIEAARLRSDGQEVHGQMWSLYGSQPDSAGPHRFG
jgi:hypothetical protein